MRDLAPKEIKQLFDAYRNHDYRELYTYILQVKRAYCTLEFNYNKLKNLFIKWEDEVEAQKGKEISFTQLSEGKKELLIIYFHNFVVSVYTYENHIRNVGKNNHFTFLKDDFSKGLQNHPSRLFLFAFRNYFQHEASPDIGISIHSWRDKDGSNLTRGKFIFRTSTIKYKYQKLWLRSDEKFAIFYSYISAKYRSKLTGDLVEEVDLGHEVINVWHGNALGKMQNVAPKEFEEVEFLQTAIKNHQSKLMSKI